jgi:CHAT domain-containing protein/predicted negative regulator of RcsB-dependent stress response
MITLAKIRRLADRQALHKHLSSHFGGSVEAFMVALDAGLNGLIRTDLGKAKEYVSYSEKCSDHLPDRYKPRFVSQQARYALWAGDYQLAHKKYSRALKLFLKYRDFEAAARLRKGLVDVLMYLGRYRDALETGKKAVRYFRGKDLAVDAAQTMCNIGNVYHRMDRNREALLYYDKARKAFEKSGGVALAIVDYNRANIYANLNQLERAKELYRQSADYYRRAGMKIARCQAEYSIAYLLFLEDRYTDALTAFERVRDSFSELGDVKTATITSLDLVELYLQLNQYGTVIMQGEEVIPRLRKLGMAYEEAKARYFVAVAKLELADHSSSLRELDKAGKLFSKEDNNLWLGMIGLARARIFLAKKRFRQAIRTSVETERFFGRSRDYRRQTDALLVRLQTLYASGETGEASGLAEKLGKRQLVGHQQYRLHNITGDYYFQRQAHSEALGHYRAAIRTVEKTLSGLYQDEIRFFFAADKYRCYSRVIECMLRLKEVDRAFLSNLSALALINRAAIPRNRLRAEIPPNLGDEIKTLRASLNRLQQLPGEGKRGSVGVSAYLSTEQKLWQCQRKAQAILYQKGSTRTGRSPDIRDCLKYLREDETLINFYAGNQLAGAFVSSNGQTHFVSFDTTPGELRVMVRKLCFVLERAVSGSGIRTDTGKLTQHYLGQLYEAVISPLLERITGDRLLIIPDDLFRQVPFIALCDHNGIHLKDRFKLQIVINPEDLLKKSCQATRFSSSRNAVFGVPSASLPLVDTESRRIKQAFTRSTLYLGPAANCDKLNRELARADGFIHIATHASRSSENPLFSRILMSDGPYFPFDLAGNGIIARLVTLSGCQTAAPGLYYGNSFSLAGAFYHAGSQYVLASLWPVLDEASVHFMTEFYRRLKKTNDVAGSYIHAVNRLQEVTDNPAVWGSFVLLGR